TILRNPVVIFSSLGLFFYSGIVSLLTTWLTIYLTGLNIEISFSSAILSVFWVFNIIGILITGKIMGKISEINLLFIYTLIGGISAIFYILLSFIIVKIIIHLFFKIFYASIFPLLTSIASKVDKEMSGSIIGVTNAMTLLGFIVFHPLIGSLVENYGSKGINYLLIPTVVMEFIFIFVLFKLLEKGKRNKDMILKLHEE
ncbi:MAG: MFS transporter, partial [Actinobacteria bacterium]|nr:MFS transporter [Actinomycetota bacterium]